MTKDVTKSKMTLDKLARMTHGEFLSVRKEMSDGFADVRKEMSDGFIEMRKDIIEEVRDVVREENVRVISSNEKVASRLDDFLKDQAAHTVLHKRITDELHGHDQRIKKLEAKV